MTRHQIAWRILTLRCEEASRLSSESLDRDLPARDGLAWRLHLLICASCRRYRRDLVSLRRLATRMGEPVDRPSAVLPDEDRERIRRAIQDR